MIVRTSHLGPTRESRLYRRSVSLRAADVRFLLPEEPQRILLLGRAGRLSDEFLALGIPVAQEIPDRLGDGTTAIICGPKHLRAAVRCPAASVVVRGTPSLLVRPPDGWTASAYLAASGPAGPRLMALSVPRVTGYLLRDWAPAGTPAERIRAWLLAGPLGTTAATVTVLTRGADASVPYVIRAAADQSGLPLPEAWFFQLGGDTDLSRLVAHCFAPGESRPSWVVKFHRNPTIEPALGPVAEEGARTAMSRLDGSLARHAVTERSTARVGSLRLVVEDEAKGRDLAGLLGRGHGQQLPVVAHEAVAWAARLGSSSLQHPLKEREIAWSDSVLDDPAAARLRSRIVGVPGCIAHSDLASLNVVTDGRDFRVIDWETFQPRTVPLMDVVYLATDILVTRFGPSDPSERVSWALKLWRGELAQSEQCFRWLADATSGLELTDDQAAGLVVVSWLMQSDGSSQYGYLGQIGRAWMADPRLGPDWAGPGS